MPLNKETKLRNEENASKQNKDMTLVELQIVKAKTNFDVNTYNLSGFLGT